ncbi:hypothetical protein BaRGS_00028005, partial [Batillaria attramentaria]
MWRLLFCLAVLPLVCVNSQGCFLPNLTSEITIQEKTPADNITVVTYRGSAPFFEGRGGDLYVNETIDLDGNETLCRNFADYSAVYVRCVTVDSQKTILPQIELTDDYAPQFKTNFSATIPELTAINTTIVTIGLEDIEDKDCQSTVDFSRVRLGLENTAGNTFRLQGSNTIKVNRLLDFENGDTSFALNVSVRSTQPNDTRVNYALLAVTVTDIDDNDPIFNSSVYSLNVTEENNSFVLVWEETQPPIDAYDQDIQVNDPLKFSLLNPNDEAVLKINETRKFNETIQVQLQRIFDRETEPSKSVVLKDTYSVSIAEHTAKGSSVVMVTATDADEGENAEFNYTLLAHQDIFDIETLVVGHDRVGVITVKDSAALDRENSYSYNLNVRNNSVSTVIGTINATDADEGDNARVTYNMTPYGSTVCNFLEINSTTGDVILTEMMKQSDVCTALVEACDNPSDTSQSRRCTRVPMRVSLPPDVIVNTTTYQADIAENLPADTIVLQLESYDKAFVMTSSNFFKLENGLVLTRQPLDREEHDKHSLFIVTNNMRHTNITVSVTVTDVNDNYPEFLNTSTKEVSLDSSTSVGQVIATVMATDRDVGENAELTYSLHPSAYSEYFSIAYTSGLIHLRQFPETDLTSLDLVVLAADGGAPSLWTVHTIKVFLGAGTVVRKGSTPTADEDNSQRSGNSLGAQGTDNTTDLLMTVIGVLSGILVLMVLAFVSGGIVWMKRRQKLDKLKRAAVSNHEINVNPPESTNIAAEVSGSSPTSPVVPHLRTYDVGSIRTDDGVYIEIDDRSYSQRRTGNATEPSSAAVAASRSRNADTEAPNTYEKLRLLWRL